MLSKYYYNVFHNLIFSYVKLFCYEFTIFFVFLFLYNFVFHYRTFSVKSVILYCSNDILLKYLSIYYCNVSLFSFYVNPTLNTFIKSNLNEGVCLSHILIWFFLILYFCYSIFYLFLILFLLFVDHQLINQSNFNIAPFKTGSPLKAIVSIIKNRNK